LNDLQKNTDVILVYIEDWNNINWAITREKQIKKYSRKKMDLINSINKTWEDLSQKWF